MNNQTEPNTTTRFVDMSIDQLLTHAKREQCLRLLTGQSLDESLVTIIQAVDVLA